MTTRETGRGGCTTTVPRQARKQALLLLEPEQARYVDAGVVISFAFVFKSEYLYIGARQRTSGWGADLVHAPLCRLRYIGDPERWDFEIYLYSRRSYDKEQDFPFSGGSPEECFAVAADFHLLKYDVLDAGSSREGADPGSGPGFRGTAGVLPPLEFLDAVGAPEDLSVAAGRPLLRDLEAFLEFVEGRTFDLAPRTLGFRRRPLAEVNGLMQRPATLHSRPVQSDAPRVQCCFHAAEALGLLRVIRTLHRAEATEAIPRFRALEEVERLWVVLEALWHRVQWAGLGPRARGVADMQQAGRAWLGAELARRTEPLVFDDSLTSRAEVLEVFLFPFWRDAGLLNLTYDRNLEVPPHLEKRSTRLHRVEPTRPGRLAFERLSRTSPRQEHLDRMARSHDGRADCRTFLRRTEEAGSILYDDPTVWEE